MTAVAETLDRAAAQDALYRKLADVIRDGLADDPGIRQVYVGRGGREVVIVDAEYVHVALVGQQ